MSTIIFIIILLYIIVFLFGFLSYIFNAIGLYELAKREQVSPSLLAWIPYLNKYILGILAFDSSVQAIIMIIFSILCFILSLLMFFIHSSINLIFILAIVSFILSIISAIYTFVARYKVYSKYSKSIIIMTVLDIISCGIMGPIFIFAIRRNKKNND